MPKKENKTVYVNGIIEMNVEEHTVSVSGESICLTYKEYEILKIFLMHPVWHIQETGFCQKCGVSIVMERAGR